MNKLKVLRGFCLGPNGDVYPGEVIDSALVPVRMLKPCIMAGKLEEIIPDDEGEENKPLTKAQLKAQAKAEGGK
jgi:hypothetical protein